MESPFLAFGRRQLAMMLIATLFVFQLAGCTKRKSSRDKASAKVTSDGRIITSSMEDRLTWNNATLFGAYKANGKTNAAWNYSAEQALAAFAKVRSKILSSEDNWWDIIGTNCQSAVEGGCPDPMIQYLYLRFGEQMEGVSGKERAQRYVSVATDMKQSAYPSIRKYYAWLRASDAVNYAYASDTGQEKQRLRDTLNSMLGGDMLMSSLNDPSIPAEEAYEAATETLSKWRYDKNGYAQWYSTFDELFARRWGNNPMSLLLKADGHIGFAWIARGNGYANTVTDEGAKQFAENLKTAEGFLEKAWAIAPQEEQIARKMMTVELGEGKGLDRLNLWFNRAMSCNTNNYEACRNKLQYLYPRWYGSHDAMIEFGRECARSEKWGGKVPLILADAHWAISQELSAKQRADYWKRPATWSDIKIAYDKFFALNPGAVSWRQNFAWFAYYCGQYDKFNELVPQLGKINYDYFGGKETFDKMVLNAAERGSKGAAKSQ